MKPITKTVKVKNKEQTVDYAGGGGGAGVHFDMNLFMTMVFAHMNNAHDMYDDEDDSDWNTDEDMMEDMMWGERHYSSEEDEEELEVPTYPPGLHVLPRSASIPRVREIPRRRIPRRMTAPIASRMSAPRSAPVIIDLISDTDDEEPPRRGPLGPRARSLPTTSSSTTVVDLSGDAPVSSSSPPAPTSSTSSGRGRAPKRRRVEE